MKYTTEVHIHLPRKRVIELFDSTENLYKWQPGLQSFDHLEGDPGQEGAKSHLKYKMGKRDLEMVETIVARNLPDSFAATYETKGVWNRMDNEFIDKGEHETLWRTTSEFKCTGFMRLMAVFMPGMFKKQTRKSMQDFKAFAEGA